MYPADVLKTRGLMHACTDGPHAAAWKSNVLSLFMAEIRRKSNKSKSEVAIRLQGGGGGGSSIAIM